MVKLIFRLKNMAATKGIYPEVVGHRVSELHERGYSFAPNEDIREELDLPKIKLPDMDKLRKLMEDTATEESDGKGD